MAFLQIAPATRDKGVVKEKPAAIAQQRQNRAAPIAIVKSKVI
jgi:hypothetical protein